MITLITGGPGAGKTALALHLYLSESKGRPLFSNVRELTIDHSPVPHIDDWTVFENNDQGTGEFRFSFPENAVIILDEAQQFFRPRAAGSKVPPYVQAFETHRQDGIDFILMTQHSTFIDANIRKLIKNARHIFIKPGFFGRYIFQRPDLIDEDDRSQLALCKKTKYKLPAYVFPLYKSSKKHTKLARPGLPIQAYVLGVALLVLAGGGFALYGSMAEKFGDKEPEIVDLADGGAAQPRLVGHDLPVQRVPDRIIEATTPTDDHNPLSAPLYASIAPPVTPPAITGCIASARTCTCYSQQSTPVWLPESQCRDRAAGRYYDPYHQPTQREQARLETSSRRAAGEAVAGSAAQLPAVAQMPEAML